MGKTLLMADTARLPLTVLHIQFLSVFTTQYLLIKVVNHKYSHIKYKAQEMPLI